MEASGFPRETIGCPASCEMAEGYRDRERAASGLQVAEGLEAAADVLRQRLLRPLRRERAEHVELAAQALGLGRPLRRQIVLLPGVGVQVEQLAALGIARAAQDQLPAA